MGSGDVWRPGTIYLDQKAAPGEQASQERREVVRRAFLQRARGYEEQGQLHSALFAWRLAWHHGYASAAALDERLVLLRYLIDHPEAKNDGSRILAALPVEDKGQEMPASQSVGPDLRPFIEYALATDGAGAGERLIRFAQRNPKSPMAEPALMRAARISLGGEGDAGSTDSATALRALHVLMSAYPATSYGYDVDGLRGRIAFLAKDYPGALAYYRRQTALQPAHSAGPLDAIILCEQAMGRTANVLAANFVRFGAQLDSRRRAKCLAEIGDLTARLSSKSASEFGHLLRGDSAVLAGYLDYRVDFTPSTPELLSLGGCPAARFGCAALRGHIFARLSEAALKLSQDRQAESLCKSALRVSREPDDRAIAVYVEGTVAERTKRYRAALSDYSRVVRAYPKTYITAGARENIALLDERFNRLDRALDIYRTMHYDDDAAYVIDVRMSPRQLRSYIRSRRVEPDRDLLFVSLGYRYLRLHEWGRARAAFLRVPVERRVALVGSDPVQTEEDLRRLSRAIVRAGRGYRRAEAWLNFASFYSSHNGLLENSALWRGGRRAAICSYWNPNVASRADERAFADDRRQSAFGQTLTICRKIIRGYKGSEVALRAAFRGACAAEMLSRLDEPGRSADSRGLLHLEAVRLMRIAEHSSNAWVAARASEYGSSLAQEKVDGNKHSAGSLGL